ncbi:response regulator [Paenibacillus sp. SYP-B3998]|uniref:Response regulator n=1 Tax=Paenibacillus sp. SYP-B3998 TaxID=2678564 RepID=A0A6G3ZUI1_9BACL|nr:response regulator [Paenibacillus sp. SYP-B3998]NEW05775.1 response regulator [Paenibacillus sp. SYP-B3998]
MKHILIVDDEPMVRMGLAKLVRQCNPLFRTVVVANGVEALSEINRQRPDILLTDIQMPKMDGLELCKQVQAMNLNIPIAVISGYDDFTYAQKCLTYGVKEYLLKPLTEHELYPVLNKLLLQQDQSVPISFYKVEEWLERVESTIWSADLESLTRLMDDWKQGGMTKGIHIEQLERMITDGLKILVKKLNARGMVTFTTKPSLMQLNTVQGTNDYLEAELISLYNQLFLWRGGNQKSLFEEAQAYINNHISEELSLEEVAEKMGLAPTYFSYIFKKMTNETFVQYRMKKRIEMAKRLLEIPHYKVVDVGVTIGYQNYPYFTKIFKKMTGCSPTEYRSMLGIK